MRDIGANIRRARVRRKLTQDDLAQTVHTTRQTISNYETGRSRPDVETLQRLADALGVELTELLDGAKAVPENPLVSGYHVPALFLHLLLYIYHNHMLSLQK